MLKVFNCVLEVPFLYLDLGPEVVGFEVVWEESDTLINLIRVAATYLRQCSMRLRWYSHKAHQM